MFELRTHGAGPARLVVTGSLDHSTVDEFRWVADDAVDIDAVILDLEACHDLDAAGLGAIIRCIRRIHEHGGRVVVTTAEASPLGVRLRHAGVTRLAPVVERQVEAA